MEYFEDVARRLELSHHYPIQLAEIRWLFEKEQREMFLAELRRMRAGIL